MRTINSKDCGTYLYKVSLWCGCGYTTCSFNVYAFHEEEVLEYVLAYLERIEYDGLFFTEEEVDEMNLDIIEKEEMFIYIDPTMTDPSARPAYILAENAGIENLGRVA